MQLIETISARRSVRRFDPAPVEQEALARILGAGALAPSGQNRKPWKYLVFEGKWIASLADAIEAGLRRLERWKIPIGGARGTLEVVEGAPVVILAYARLLDDRRRLYRSLRSRIVERMDIQSIGASLENMSLAAVDQGLGSVWVNYILLSAPEIGSLTGEKSPLIAGLALGRPRESPRPRELPPIGASVSFFDGAAAGAR